MNRSDLTVTESKMRQILDWSYDKALNGLPGTDSAQELAQNYISKNKSVSNAIDSLIRWQEAKCATSGFITGLGGIMTLPVAIPANIASVIYVQIRMVAAIACMRGYNLHDDQVKTMVFLALTGSAATDILRTTGINIGTKMSNAFLKKMPAEVLKQINKKVGFRMVTKFGEKGTINLCKCIPVVGGIVGGTTDALGTYAIGKIAKKMFAQR